MEHKTSILKKIIWGLIGIFSAWIFCYGLIHLGGYALESYRQNKLSQELLGYREQFGAVGAGRDAQAVALPDAAADDGAMTGVGVSGVAGMDSSTGEADGAVSGEQLAELYAQLYERNNDYVFWLTIPDTRIDYPVVQQDNTFYLQHDFYGARNAHGAIFLDEQCAADGRALLVHGHHMKDGTMFAALKQYKDDAWCESHRTVELYDKEERHIYTVFAVARVDLTDEGSFRYEELPTEAEALKTYVDSLAYRAFWYQDPQFGETDRLLVLSTCDYGTEDERLVVFCTE